MERHHSASYLLVHNDEQTKEHVMDLLHSFGSIITVPYVPPPPPTPLGVHSKTKQLWQIGFTSLCLKSPHQGKPEPKYWSRQPCSSQFLIESSSFPKTDWCTIPTAINLLCIWALFHAKSWEPTWSEPLKQSSVDIGAQFKWVVSGAWGWNQQYRRNQWSKWVKRKKKLYLLQMMKIQPKTQRACQQIYVTPSIWAKTGRSARMQSKDQRKTVCCQWPSWGK